MISILYSPKAKADLNNIFDYIAADSLDRAIEFKNYLQKETEKLKEFTLLGTNQGKLFLIQKDIRFLINQNYLTFYRFDKENNVIRILRILNGAINYTKEQFD